MSQRKQPRGYLWPEVALWCIIVGFSPGGIRVAEVIITALIIAVVAIRRGGK